MLSTAQETEAYTLYMLRHEAEAHVETQVSLALRDYFMHPELPLDPVWPDAWKELARMNALLGLLAKGGKK